MRRGWWHAWLRDDAASWQKSPFREFAGIGTMMHADVHSAPGASLTMLLNLNHIGQIGLPVLDTDRSEAFYENVVGLRKLYRFGDLSFFDCAGVRLFLDKAKDPANFSPQGCIYFRCADIALTVAELEKRGVTFTFGPNLIAKMDDHDLWMAFFKDPDGHTLAVMQEAPKGYAPIAG
jgi:methylmalonyl-CoA/ethylmalonyl-CoA epimerase